MTGDLPEIPISQGSGWDGIEWDLEAGRQPNWREIARRLRETDRPPPTQLVRRYLADILEGKESRQPGNPKQRLTVPEKSAEHRRRYNLRKLVLRIKEHLEAEDSASATEAYNQALKWVSEGFDVPESTLDKIVYPKGRR